MMHLNGKLINLAQLRDEARTTGALTANQELGTFGDYVFTYDANGQPTDLDPVKMQPVIDKHAPLREVTDGELYTRYAEANNGKDAAAMAHIVAMVQGFAPRDRVPMTPPPPVEHLPPRNGGPP